MVIGLAPSRMGAKGDAVVRWDLAFGVTESRGDAAMLVFIGEPRDLPEGLR